MLSIAVGGRLMMEERDLLKYLSLKVPENEVIHARIYTRVGINS